VEFLSDIKGLSYLSHPCAVAQATPDTSLAAQGVRGNKKFWDQPHALHAKSKAEPRICYPALRLVQYSNLKYGYFKIS
jgi:hypothetical protein